MDLKIRLVILLSIFIFLTGIIVSEDPIKTVWSISSFGEDDFFHQPFRPGAPKIVRQSSKDGATFMMATYDYITQDARIGPEGNLYLLTFAESTMERQKPRKDEEKGFPPVHMRIDVIDTKTHELLRHIEIDGDTRVFSFLNENQMVYMYIDSEGEVILKCI